MTTTTPTTVPPTTTTTTAITTTSSTTNTRTVCVLVEMSCICFLTVNAVLVLVRAHRQGHLTSVLGGVIFTYLLSVSIICCFVALSFIPIEEDSTKKYFLILMALLLSAALVFAAIIRVSTSIGVVATTIILCINIALFGSAFYLIICRGYIFYNDSNKFSTVSVKAASHHEIVTASVVPNSPLDKV